MNKNILKIVIVILLVSVSINLTFLFLQLDKKQENKSYPFLANRIFQEDPNDIRVGFSPLRTKLANYVNSQAETNNAINVYFEYLPTGASVRINDELKSIGASLIKVPLAMSLYERAEKGTIDLNEVLVLQEGWLDIGYGDLYKGGAGFNISVDELLQLMLRESDNTATNALWSIYERTDDSYDEDVLNYLDIEFQVADDGRIIIGARQYSAVLKCLYFACFNSVDDSQHILELLTQTDVDNRLRRYLKDEPITVSHKVGTFLNEYQSDCGIFYLERNNYLLCVMINGEEAEASRQIGELSNIVYRHMKEISEQ